MIQESPKSSKFPYKKHTEERRRGKRTKLYRDGDRSGVMSPQAKKALLGRVRDGLSSGVSAGSTSPANIFMLDFLLRTMKTFLF